jgi:ribosomal protein S18 acetylase RimI-like enzyme
LRLRSLSDAPYAFGSTLAEAVTYTDLDWQTQLERGPYLVASSESGDVGVLRLAPGDSSGEWWLYSLWIAPETRGTGLVDQLIAGAEALVRDHGGRHLFLDVARQNHRAIAAYRRLGFQEIEGGHNEAGIEITLRRVLP